MLKALVGMAILENNRLSSYQKLNKNHELHVHHSSRASSTVVSKSRMMDETKFVEEIIYFS